MCRKIKLCYTFIAIILLLALVAPASTACRGFDVPVIRRQPGPIYGPYEKRSSGQQQVNWITVAAGANGSISPSSRYGYVPVRVHTDQDFIITPDAGHKIADVKVDGQSIPVRDPSGFTHTFTQVSSDHTISATFIELASVTYIITATAGPGGLISPAGRCPVNKGGSQRFTIQANSGYDVADVQVDGESVGRRYDYQFDNVTRDRRIGVSFTQKKAPTTMYDGAYKGTFNYKYRKIPIKNDTDPWTKVTMGVTVDLRTRDIQNGKVILDVTRVSCSDYGFDALNGVSPINNSNAVFPANPPNAGATDCTMNIYFPDGAVLNIYSGKDTENYVSLDGETLYGSKWDAQNVKSFPLSGVGSEIKFGGWDLIKQTGPDVWGHAPLNDHLLISDL